MFDRIPRGRIEITHALPQIQILYSQAERNRSRQAGMRRRDEVEH